jgi:hypothetical protein
MIENMDVMFANFFPNFVTYMFRWGFPLFVGLWYADNYGMFSNQVGSQNGFDQIFPTMAEAI